MNQVEARSLLEQSGALLQGHFEYTSGRHGSLYIEKFAFLQWPDTVTRLCAPIVNQFAVSVNLVAGPTTGGVILSFEVARQLGIRSIIAERSGEGEGREFKRGFQIGRGDQVLVVDDVLTTGGSIRAVMDAIRKRGAQVAGVGVLVDRTGGKTDFGVPFISALTLEIPSFVSADCPLCAQGVPLTKT